jgi:uncharacterized membrane protein
MKSRAMRRATVRYFWDRMKVSLWFVPLVMALAAILLSWLLSLLDERVPNEMLNDSRFFIAGSASEMRAMMIGIAGTVLATAGVVFSLLTLPMSTVASQFGSRLLRIFLRDRTTQFVLGMFVGTFTYCLATAFSIPLDATQSESLQITVTFGMLLMLITFASLIILIQHISTMLQAPNIVAAAGADLMDVISMGTPEEADENQKAPEERIKELLVESEAFQLRVKEKGYIQFVDPQIIMNLASEKDLVIYMLRKPGQFIRSGEIAALVWPAAKVEEHLATNLRRSIQIGNQRTPTQDVEYAINQLVEVAVRAMSPAINDPFTALTCLDYLADGLAQFTRYGEGNSNFFDDNGRLRLVYEPVDLDELLDAAFNMLRHASCDNATVLLHILDTIDVISQETKSLEAIQGLLRHVYLVKAESHVGALIEADKHRILQCVEMLETKFTSTEQGLVLV